MPTHGLMNLLGGVRGRLASIPIIATLLVYPQVASAEPLGYVLRPDRQDIGVLDSRDDTVLGGIPLSTALGDDIGTLNFLSLSPDGRVGLIGATQMGLGRLDVLKGGVVETLGPRGIPEAVDATAAVFHPDSKIAYVSLFGSELLEVDTSDGRVEILRSFAAPTFLQLFYVPAQSEHPVLSRPLLFGLREDGRIAAFDLELGQEIGPEIGKDNPVLRGQLRLFSEVVDMTVEPNGSIWALTREGIVLILSSWAGPLDRVWANTGALLDLTVKPHFAISEGGRALYLANPGSAFKLECLESKYVASCSPGFIGITEIVLGEVTETGQVLPFDGDNPIGDLALTSDEATLYVVGRRTIFRIDTAAAELVAWFRMRAGGGFLGQMAIGELALPPCAPQSTSILALRKEINKMNTSKSSRAQAYFRLDKARTALLAGDIATGRSQLQQVIAKITVRSNLPEGDSNRIPPDQAASVICATANLLERVRLE